jgi:hypothetical protein
MNIWIVNESSYDNEAGESWYFSTEEKAIDFMDDLRKDYQEDDTYEDYPKEKAFGKDGCHVYRIKVKVQ